MAKIKEIREKRTVVRSMTYYGESDLDDALGVALDIFKNRGRSAMYKEGDEKVTYKRRKGSELDSREQRIAFEADEARFWEAFLEGDQYRMRKAFNRLPVGTGEVEKVVEEQPSVESLSDLVDRFINMPFNQMLLKEANRESSYRRRFRRNIHRGQEGNR